MLLLAITIFVSISERIRCKTITSSSLNVSPNSCSWGVFGPQPPKQEELMQNVYVIYRREIANFLVKRMFLPHLVFTMISFDLVIWNLAEGKIKGNFLWLTTLSIRFEQLKRPLWLGQAENHYDISFFLLMHQLRRLNCNLRILQKSTPLLFLVVFLGTNTVSVLPWSVKVLVQRNISDPDFLPCFCFWSPICF